MIGLPLTRWNAAAKEEIFNFTTAMLKHAKIMANNFSALIV
jgi:hypothetical protein